MSGTVDRSKFQIEVNDEVTLGRNSMIEHAEYGPMMVDQISVGQDTKYARFESDLHDQNLSIELSDDEIREMWNETIAQDPFKLHDDGSVSYEKQFSDKEDELDITIQVSGPEDDAEPVMAHLHDQTVRVLQALENREPPEESEGVYGIDWEAILEEDGGDDG